jgi:hypothetical protein
MIPKTQWTAFSISSSPAVYLLLPEGSHFRAYFFPTSKELNSMIESIRMGEGEGGEERMAEFFSPAQIDISVRQAIQWCWMSLPKNRRNQDEAEKQFRRIVDRALKDFREDSEAFGRSQ